MMVANVSFSLFSPPLAGGGRARALNLTAAPTMWSCLAVGRLVVAGESQPVGMGSGSEYVCRGSGLGAWRH